MRARPASHARPLGATDMRGGGWQPSTTLVRAALVSVACGVTAVVAGRPDVLVLGAPLLVHAVVALGRRPPEPPVVRSRL